MWVFPQIWAIESKEKLEDKFSSASEKWRGGIKTYPEVNWYIYIQLGREISWGPNSKGTEGGLANPLKTCELQPIFSWGFSKISHPIWGA